MNYNEFMEYVCESIKKYMGEEYNVTISRVLKNNGIELTGLVIMKNGKTVAPTIYLDDFFTEYQKGRSVNEMIETIADTYEKNDYKLDFSFDFFRNYESIKDRVLYKVLNYEANTKLLEDVPHVKYLDLAIVFYIMLDSDIVGNGTILIRNSHVSMWKVSKNIIYEDAVRNTPRILPFRFSSMENIVAEIYGHEEAKSALSSDDCSACGMYVLSNSLKLNGACCILYDKVLEMISDKIESDMYIIPSSIHEVIILPKKRFSMDKDQIEDMVRSVNNTGVDPAEVLGYHVYEYRRAMSAVIM